MPIFIYICPICKEVIEYVEANDKRIYLDNYCYKCHVFMVREPLVYHGSTIKEKRCSIERTEGII